MRPSRYNNPELNRLIACDIAPKLALALGTSLEDQDTLVDDIENILDGAISLDGYALALKLEELGAGYGINTECVNILDSADIIAFKHLRKLTEKWVADNKIKPTLKIGDKVAFLHGTKNVEGEVIHISEKSAMYHLYVPELGHVKEKCGVRAVLRTFEEIDK